MSNADKKSQECPSFPIEETDFLKNKFLKKFIKSKWYPLVFQIPTAIVFTFIIVELLAGPSSPHDNFGTAMTWILWWPIIPIIFLLFGRFWCAVCPFGTLNDVIQKYVGSNKPVPKFLKKYGIWIIDATFILITWSDHVFGIVESPRGSAVVLLLITTGVVVSGALWERRTWCRYLCFLGGVSGNYSRAGMLELKGTPEKCSKCKVAACYNGNEKAPGCPMFEFPRTMESVANCNLCGHCVKSCPNDSIRIAPRIPTKGLWFIGRAKIEESFLAAVIMGIVFVQNITMIDIWDGMLSKLEAMVGTDNYFVTFTITFIIAMSIPIAMLALTGYIAGNFKKESLVKNFARFGYSIIPLDVAGHIAHNLFHLLAEGKSIFYTAIGLFGIEPANPSMAIVDNMTIQVLQYILIAFGTIGSVYTAYRLTKSNPDKENNTLRTFIPFAVLMIVFAVINIYLFSVPMEMRM
ncbi:4Fe-4S binding protein [Clostridium aminobutyricum]|uniref:4Fe-4S binding protein n=1 Tax=Clostridium aminobutyricum TaxID=33953 RepID=A0A939D6M1_CLOAM|nr:4Fe-4S binding protein [Clostridium aminobutyricum]MBN7772494.1 4Fe-4S binding protein [Clostridium aminobutyricum]